MKLKNKKFIYLILKIAFLIKIFFNFFGNKKYSKNERKKEYLIKIELFKYLKLIMKKKILLRF